MVSVAPGGVRHAPSGTALPGTAAVSAAHSGGRALRLSAGMAEAEVRGKLGPVRKDGAQSKFWGNTGAAVWLRSGPTERTAGQKALLYRTFRSHHTAFDGLSARGKQAGGVNLPL
mgnify:CR=1 FL=1